MKYNIFKKVQKQQNQKLPFSPVKADKIIAGRNDFSASAENFINTQPNFILYGPIFIIFLIIFAALIYSVFATIETKVTSMLTVDGENYLVQSPVDGSISAIIVSVNEEVKNGDEILTVFSESTLLNDESIAALKSDINDLEKKYNYIDFTIRKISKIVQQNNLKNSKFFVEIIENETDNIPENISKKSAEYEVNWNESEYFSLFSGFKVQSENLHLSFYRALDQLNNQKKVFEADKNLYNKKAITEIQFNQSSQLLSSLESETESLISSYKMLVYNILEELYEEKTAIIQNYKNNLLQLEESETVEDQVVMNGRVALIKSKYPGVVAEQYVKNFQFISRGSILLKIIRNDLPKTGKVYISNENIGKIQIGQKVFIKFDAFPYQQFGAQNGVITSVTPDVKLVDGIGFAYVADVAFEQFNSKISIKYGMRGTAEILTGEKRLIELIFAPISKVFDYLKGTS